tara:strand:+ start:2396 stop:2617 length:222 start_codon:yes stop_codon:yes gene_type:complete
MSVNLNTLFTQLHEELGQVLLEKLRDPDIKSADLNVIRQFLKDNDVVAIPTDSNALGSLLEELPFDEATDKIN